MMSPVSLPPTVAKSLVVSLAICLLSLQGISAATSAPVTEVDVYLVMEQSNAVGQGEALSITDPNVWYLPPMKDIAGLNIRNYEPTLKQMVEKIDVDFYPVEISSNYFFPWRNRR